MKKLTIISGKGGTGKTTVAASFASLSSNSIFADCDCDAPDLQLILKPETIEKEEYIGSAVAVRETDCSMCGKCREVCRFNAIDEDMNIIETRCEGCGACAFICPENAIEMKREKTGTIYKSQTRFGPMVHAELKIGEEASGKMVTQVRKRTQDIVEDEELLIIDGSPGTGCPVIASINGVDSVLIVVEPTVTGVYDMERVIAVTKHFNIPASVCINKYDINEDKTREIEEVCQKQGIPVLGKLPYDDVATEAMIAEKSVVEYSDSELSKKIKEIWEKQKSILDEVD
ncbi:MAG: 4Fe-4S binding protein [Hadesarchaea archaeon]|nr:4Fe-4S binding protein [Hadesarchaea archaeon]